METVTLKLTANTYNTIVRALQQMPWREAQPCFQEIDPQIRAALAKDGTKPSKKSLEKGESK